MTAQIPLTNSLDKIPDVQICLTKHLEDGGCDPEKIDEMCLICEEILVNIISHGFEPDQVSEIKVVCRDSDEMYVLEFHDQGKFFNPLEADERPEGKVGGWGIPLVVALSDHVEYSSDSKTNVLRVHVSKRENHG
jgi:anti-sigma regulatory factor (Ser/Thr protein kinase)